MAACAAQKGPESKEASDKCCPVCARRSLILRQINVEEAIYVCENPACCYPVGYDAKFIKRPILAGLREKQGAANPLGKETNMSNDGTSTAFHPVQGAGMCEDAPWHSTAVMDSLLDPDVADFLDSMQ